MYRIVVFIGALLFLSAGCVEPQTSQQAPGSPSSPYGTGGKGDTLGSDHFEASERDGECDEAFADLDPDCFIRIASWNIQDFSVNKARDPKIIAEIADAMRRFDVIAVQEVSNIRERHDAGCDRNADCPDHENCGAIRDALEQALNEAYDRDYAFVFSDQIRQERYLYIYDTERVEMLHDQLMVDEGDSLPICDYRPESTGAMVRQPHLGVFQAGDFSFALLNAHTSPEKNIDDLDALAAFEREVQDWGISDVVILGDLNADCRYLSQDEDIDLRHGDHLWLFYLEDTTVGSTECEYDQMLIREESLEDLTGDVGIYTDISEEVSDHFPVWAHFYIGRDTDAHEFDVPRH